MSSVFHDSASGPERVMTKIVGEANLCGREKIIDRGPPPRLIGPPYPPSPPTRSVTRRALQVMPVTQRTAGQVPITWALTLRRGDRMMTRGASSELRPCAGEDKGRRPVQRAAAWQGTGPASGPGCHGSHGVRKLAGCKVTAKAKLPPPSRPRCSVGAHGKLQTFADTWRRLHLGL